MLQNQEVCSVSFVSQYTISFVQINFLTLELIYLLLVWAIIIQNYIRPNKKISAFRVMGLNILGGESFYFVSSAKHGRHI